MSFSVFNSNIILCSADNVISYDYKTKSELSIELPKLIISDNLKLHNNLDIEACHGITSITFSSDGQYYCVCTNRKQLCIYKRKDNTLVSNRTLVRAASKVQFTPKNDVIVADKSGDVYLYHTSNYANEGQLILGHLSMLLDVLVTSNNDFIITADRDEKIRVSKFPNAYNIHSYCLGHTKFVNNIIELPHDIDILVSAGGDGVFKFWDFKNGVELNSVSYKDKINEDDVSKLNENLRNLELTEVVDNLPVKHMRVMKFDDNYSILIFSFYGNGNIIIYHVTGTLSSGLNVNFKQKIYEKDEPLECILQKQQMWLLFDDGLKIFKLKDEIFIENTEMNDNLKALNESWSLLRSKVINKLNLYPILYKRKFDTVQEYQERKKSRLTTIVD
ncbi:tRNA (guanine-N(7)-)-methyltransferase non-catalytic subunit wdr4 [Microplitis demolitor]|uniref:tRNA (guanine-N(7)-)-methyltransferase non-catalytic subunit wdr4 n=1 Tax=Microplitis demolitor TaxID=69319 RepID=UPI0004CD3C62|nr:tRNA (guanine-N(7)-)-methyltransferase non-catalytic subunit wdr4 [Microplitis demolitor]